MPMGAMRDAGPFSRRSWSGAYLGSTLPENPMNPLRSLGWTLLLTSWLAGGCVPQGEAGVPQKTRKLAEGPAPAPPSATPPSAPVQPVAVEELPRAWPWVVEDDDEFEGEGWTFWPLAAPRR